MKKEKLFPLIQQNPTSQVKALKKIFTNLKQEKQAEIERKRQRLEALRLKIRKRKEALQKQQNVLHEVQKSTKKSDSRIQDFKSKFKDIHRLLTQRKIILVNQLCDIFSLNHKFPRFSVFKLMRKVKE